jgi:hypothetical protein
MSNLKLPTMSYENLSSLAPRDGSWKKVAYATWIRHIFIGNGIVEVKHHASIIATITKKRVVLDNHGYNTPTTSNRLNRIVRDNGITDRWVGIKQYSMGVRGPGGQTITETFPTELDRP